MLCRDALRVNFAAARFALADAAGRAAMLAVLLLAALLLAAVCGRLRHADGRALEQVPQVCAAAPGSTTAVACLK